MRWPVMMAEGAGDGAGSGAGLGSAGGEGGSLAAGQGSVAPGLLSGGANPSLMDWRSDLSEVERGYPIVQRLNSKSDVVRTLREQEQMIGRSLGSLPTEEPGTPEHAAAMAKIYAKLGRPETAKDYTLSMPEGREWDAETESAWRQAFHAQGLTQAQVDAMVSEYWRMIQRNDNIRAGQWQRSESEGLRALDAEFGPLAQEKLNYAKYFFQQAAKGAFGGAEVGEEAMQLFNNAMLEDGTRLANHPVVIAAFSDAGRRMYEGAYVDGAALPSGMSSQDVTRVHQELTGKKLAGTATPEELQLVQRYAEIIAANEAREQQGGTRRRVA